MFLPNKEQAIISAEKLKNYLLSDSHPIGRSKATFFKGLGFSATNVSEFDQAIRDLIQTHAVQETLSTAYGTKYIVNGILNGSAQQSHLVRTVWIVEEEGEETYPKLVTVYPIDTWTSEDET